MLFRSWEYYTGKLSEEDLEKLKLEPFPFTLKSDINIYLESDKDIIKALKEKDFASARKWVTQNTDNDPAKIYRKIYDSLYEYLKADSIPQAVLIIAKYQYQSSFVADVEINLVACLTELMVECEFK